MTVKNAIESEDLKSIALALADCPAKGTTLFRISARAQLPLSRVRKLLDKHSDYFVNVAGSGFYALNRFGPHKGESEAVLKNINQEAQAALIRRKTALVLLVIVFVLFIVAK